MSVSSRLGVHADEGLAVLVSTQSSTRRAEMWATTLNVALDGDIEVETAHGRARGRVVLSPPGLARESRSRGPVLTVLLDADDHRAAWCGGVGRGPIALATGVASSQLATVAEQLWRGAPLSGPEVLRRTAAVVGTGGARYADPRIARLVDELRRAPTLGRPLQSEARALGLTPEYLSERFAQVVGVPLRRWLLWERARRALPLLATVAGTQAAHEAGFSDQAHMVRSFARFFGYTPGSLRRAARR